VNPSRYLPPPAAANPIPTLLDDDSDDGWVTMFQTRDPRTRRWILTQKRDGSTRTVFGGQA
jgi:hypothetical protein